MKSFRIFNIEVKFSFSIKRVKRIEFSLPDNADDAHLRQGSLSEWGTSDGKTKIVYWMDGMKEIDLPPHKEAKEVFCSPLYEPIKRQTYATNRKIIIDLYY